MPRRLSIERVQQISQLAESVSEFYFPESWIDPEAILKENQVTISFNRYGKYFDGMLECIGGRFHVYCNLEKVDSRTSPRSRFTLAHEFAHFFLEEHRSALLQGRSPAHPSICCRPDAELIIEREADLFASRLLMPEVRFQKGFGGIQPAIPVIERVAATFKVSFQSAVIRFVENSSAPCAAVMWRRLGKPWYLVNESMMALGLMSMRLNMGELPRDSATIRCWEDEAAGGAFNSPHECVTTASLWFWNVAKGGGRDIYLKEESVRLGEYGCLSLLSLHPLL